MTRCAKSVWRKSWSCICACDAFSGRKLFPRAADTVFHASTGQIIPETYTTMGAQTVMQTQVTGVPRSVTSAHPVQVRVPRTVRLPQLSCCLSMCAEVRIGVLQSVRSSLCNSFSARSSSVKHLKRSGLVCAFSGGPCIFRRICTFVAACCKYLHALWRHDSRDERQCTRVCHDDPLWMS